MRFQSSLAVGGAEFGLSSFGHNRRHIDCPYGMVGTAAAEAPISGKLRFSAQRRRKQCILKYRLVIRRLDASTP